MKVLVTGGAGYIGSHTVVELIAAGHSPIIVDNFVNSKPEVLARLKQITGADIPFYELDVCDVASLGKVAQEHQIETVIHFAGLKAVGESVEKPLEYYRNNLDSTMAVAHMAKEYNVKHIVFSSSATVYGDPESVPIPETAKLSATNPYGQTKLMSEQILTDAAHANGVATTLLRYFNPIGAHESGLIGEDPTGVPNNLLPYVAQVAVGRLESVQIFGDDYPTPDGTGVRDYIHVVDLAKGHVAALAHPPKTLSQVEGPKVQVAIYNLGTGQGHSVKEIIAAFEQASGKTIAANVVARRPGDIAQCYADVTKAERELGWKAQYDLAQMCRDSWNWQSKNPNGYSV